MTAENREISPLPLSAKYPHYMTQPPPHLSVRTHHIFQKIRS